MKKNTMQQEIDYEQALNKLVKFLDKEENRIIVLATSQDNKVMARNIIVTNDRLDLYFFTWAHSRKYKQIQKNANVALCRDLVQIEGTAEIVGPMSAETSKPYLEIIGRKDPKAVKRWQGKPNMIIAKITPRFACVDSYYENGEAYIEYLDIQNQRAFKEKWGNY